MTLAPYRPRSHGPDCEACAISGWTVLVCAPAGPEYMQRQWFEREYRPLPERRLTEERRRRCGGRRRQDRTRSNVRGEE